MSDTALNKIIQYGTQAQRIAFVPNPAVGPPVSQVLYIWYETDNVPDLYIWDGTAWVLINSASGSAITQLTGDVTAIGPGSVAATIANNAVTNAKLADVNTATFKGRTTAGAGDPEDLTATQATALLNVLVGDSGAGGTKGLAPAPAAGDAAAGKFLKADGTYQVPAGGGGLVLLSSQIASNSASLDFASVITSLYDEYAIEFINLVPVTTNVELLMRVSTDNGATYDSGTNYVFGGILSRSGTTTGVGGTAQTSMRLTGGGTLINTAAIGGFSGSFRLYNPLSTTMRKALNGFCNLAGNDGNFYCVNMSNWYTPATAVNAFRILMSSGNISSGIVRLYGLAKP